METTLFVPETTSTTHGPMMEHTSSGGVHQPPVVQVVLVVVSINCPLPCEREIARGIFTFRPAKYSSHDDLQSGSTLHCSFTSNMLISFGSSLAWLYAP